MLSRKKPTAVKARPGKKSAPAKPEQQEGDREKVEAEALVQQSRLQHAQTQLETTYAAYEQLCDTHKRLQERQRHDEREGYELAELFRRQMLEKNEQLKNLQQEVASCKEQLQKSKDAAAAWQAQRESAFEAERQQMGAAAAALQANVDSLQQFGQDKDSMEAEVKRLRQENVRIAEGLGEKVRTLQRRLYDLGYGADGSGDAPEAGPSEDRDGEDLCLEADLHRVLAHSRKVEDGMKQYGQEAEELQREMKALEAERAALLRDVRLKDEMEKQYAKRGTMQAREIRDAHSKIGTLERGLAQMAADFEVEKAALEQQLRAQLAEAINEQQSLRRLLRLRTKELRRVRHLAQEVLLQRSDVEAFLVSSIQHVRVEVAAAAAARGGPKAAAPHAEASTASHAAGSSAARLRDEQEAGSGGALEVSRSPSRVGGSGKGAQTVGGAASGPPVARPAGGHIDVKDLSWEDRERVLRLLFTKINRAAQQRTTPLAAHRSEVLPETQLASPLPELRGLATDAGPAGLA